MNLNPRLGAAVRCCSDTQATTNPPLASAATVGARWLKRGKLVDQKFTGDRRARWRKNPAIDILHAAGGGFIKTGPDHDDIAIGQGGDGRADLKIIRGGVDHHVTRQPRIAGREKPGVNVLESLFARPATQKPRRRLSTTSPADFPDRPRLAR